jgi:hypothetical protein
VAKPIWTKRKYGNWLHKTKYGFHSAIDIFATKNGTPEAVLSPVDGVVYKVYNKDGISLRRIFNTSLRQDSSISTLVVEYGLT